MATTRATIESDIGDYLNRTDLSTIISTWFKVAHKAIQRRRDWQCMEATDNITLTANVISYTIASFITDFKSPRLLYLWDTVNSRVTRFYEKKSIADVRWRRYSTDEDVIETEAEETPDAYIYAIWDEKIEIWPKLDATAIANRELRFDYYAYLDPPASGSSDFFTNNAFDYLMYRALLEAPTYLADISKIRIEQWEKRMQLAWNELVGDEIARTGDGEDLVMRG